MTKACRIKVFGKVQGVFYRASSKDLAEKLYLKGFARNEDDGSVYIEVEGEPENVDHFIKWTHEGPPKAHVDNVEVEEQEPQNYSSFDTNR